MKRPILRADIALSMKMQSALSVIFQVSSSLQAIVGQQQHTNYLLESLPTAHFASAAVFNSLLNFFQLSKVFDAKNIDVNPRSPPKVSDWEKRVWLLSEGSGVKRK